MNENEQYRFELWCLETGNMLWSGPTREEAEQVLREILEWNPEDSRDDYGILDTNKVAG